jgi:hypothetical protein
MANHDIETNKNLNFEIKLGTFLHQIPAPIARRTMTCEAGLMHARQCRAYRRMAPPPASSEIIINPSS